MNAQDFVAAVRSVVRDAAVITTVAAVQKPPGRHPANELAELSLWYNGLSASDQAMIKRLLTIASHSAVFGLLAVLDGARAVDPNSTGQDYFELRHFHGKHQDVLSGPNGTPLHELL